MANNYILLLYKQLEGSISSLEKKQLSEWRQANANNELEARSVELAWKATAPTSTPTVNLDQEFDALQARIHQDKGNIVGIGMRKKFPFLSIAASLLFLVAAGLFVYNWSNGGTALEYQIVQTTSSPQNITLADNSVVHLNAHSQLKYPTAFDGKHRKIELKGEAFFDVAHNPAQPFIVETSKEKIRVLGTSFNVNAQPDAPSATVYVVTGKVEFGNKAGDKKVVLTKGNSATYDHQSDTFAKQAAATANAIAWKTQQLSFKETTVKEAFSIINDNFGLVFEVENEDLLDCLLDMSFNNNDINVFIEEVTILFDAQITKIDNKKYRIKDGSCQ